MFDCSEYTSGSINYFCKKLHLRCLFGFAIGQSSKSNYTVTKLSTGVLEESCLGNLVYFLKYMLELSFCNKDKITSKYLKRSPFKNIDTKTEK